MDALQKTTAKIWRPVLDRFNRKIEAACLRRDGYLARVLATELPVLAGELTATNSDAARTFIARHLDALERKAVTFTIPSETLRELDAICERRNIIRDAFWNRLLFVLSAESAQIDWIFFDGRNNWRTKVWEERRNDGPVWQNAFMPLDPAIDPFWAVHVGLEMRREAETDFSDGMYSLPLTDFTFPARNDDVRVDLYGLNCCLADHWVPGTADHARTAVSLDDLLNESMGRS